MLLGCHFCCFCLTFNRLLISKLCIFCCEIYRRLTRSVLLYGYESWTIRAKDASALGVAWSLEKKDEPQACCILYSDPSTLAVAKTFRIRCMLQP